MKKMLNVRNIIIVILCITIICMGIGFIILSVELKNKKDEIKTYDIAITKVKKISSVKGSNIEPIGKINITSDGKILDMNFELNAIHDELTYIATIKNTGTMPAEIIDVLESPNYKEENFHKLIAPVSITISDIKGKILKAGESTDLKIFVYYKSSTAPVTKKNIPYKLGIISKSN